MLKEVREILKSFGMGNEFISQASNVPRHFVNDLSSGAIERGTSQYKNEDTIQNHLNNLKKFFETWESDESYAQKLTDQVIDDKKNKYKDRRQNTLFNKQVREETIVENFFNDFNNQLKELSNAVKIDIKPSKTLYNGDKDIIIMLTDWHIGSKFSSLLGEFNYEIARERVTRYLDKIIEIKKTHKISSCYVTLQGDMISGNIHESIKVTNEFNESKQLISAFELLLSFIKTLSQEFSNVYVTSVAGNHSRIDLKEMALKDERLDDIIFYMLKTVFNNINKDVKFIDPITNTLAKINVQGKDYIVCHGDYDRTTDNGIAQTITFINSQLHTYPYAILYGHLHHPLSKSMNNVQVVQGGCLPGSGDDFTEQKRLSGNASQTVLVCTNKGIDCIYNVDLQ